MLFLSLVLLIFSGCASFPSLPNPPKVCDKSKCATFKLMRTNKHWWGMGDYAALLFGGRYSVRFSDDWEKSNGGWTIFTKKVKFNDKAIFSLPAGMYNNVVFIVNTPFLSGIPGPLMVRHNRIDVKPGANYEIWLSVDYDKGFQGAGGYMKISIDRIVEVKSFQENKID